MLNPSKRMTANPARPVARYRPGKATQEETSEEEDESEEEVDTHPSAKIAKPKATSFPAGAHQRPVPARPAQKEESEDEEGFITEEEESGSDAGGVKLPVTGAKDDAHEIDHKPRATTVSTGTIAARVRAAEEDSEDSEHSEEDPEDEEEEESSSEDEPRRKFQRPTFIKKSDRAGATPSATASSRTVGTNGMITTSPILDVAQSDEMRRKEMADLMIKDKLERDAAARAAGRKGWDDDDEVAAEDVVDDTDGLDPEAEYAAWKIRELKRLKRDREAVEQREKEIEEVERRRNLTQAEREAEDREYLDQQKEEREEGRGKAGFLQRYHHKGAFFQDDETAEILRRRDLMGAKFVDEVQDREALPQYMRVRDMTKLGKKGRTRYTDLRGEDTGNWGQGYDQKDRRGSKTGFDVDERFRPDHEGGMKGPTGANASTVRDRREREIDGVPKGPRAMQNGDKSRDGGDSYRPRRESYDRDADYGGRSKGRSLSPRQRHSTLGQRSRSRSRNGDRYGHEDGRSRRKRSPSPYQDQDKRRRVEAS
jgi:microfibrillar-associated protein 1